MKINNLTKTNLSEALKFVSIRGKTTIPILNSYFIRADENGLSVTNANTDQTIIYRIPAGVEEPGQVCIPKDKLSGFVSNMPSVCKLETINATASFTYGDGNKINIRTLDPKDYPSFETDTTLATFPAKKELLADLKRKILFAASTDKSRSIFQCVYLHAVNDKLTFVATDTYCMAVLETDIQVDDVTALIPAEFLAGLRIDDNFTIEISAGRTSFVTERIRASCRLMTGKFPEYRRLIPEGQTRVTTERQPLIDALNRTALMGNIAQLETNLAGLEVSQIGEHGEIRELLPAKNTGEVKIYINIQMLKNILLACNEDIVTIEFNGEFGAVVIKEEGFVGLMLPVRRTVD